MKCSKRYRAIQSKEKQDIYDIKGAVEFIRECATAKFDETVELTINLGIDPKKEHVRGTALLPHGTGKTKRVLALAEGPKAKEAQEAGADFVGSDEYLKQIEGGWLEFDTIVATPDLMTKISKLGKLLGPRGLMPNPKTGTLTMDIGKAIKEVKMGKVELKMDKAGVLHLLLGKVSFKKSFTTDKLHENICEVLKSVWSAKPTSVKAKNYLKTVYLSSTMGVGVKLDPKDVEEGRQK